MLHAIAPSHIPWSSHLPPGRLSPPWALFGQGSYLHHSDRLHHPSALVSVSPVAEKETLRQDLISGTSSKTPLPNWGKQRRKPASARVGSSVVRGVPSAGVGERWPFERFASHQKALPERGASSGPRFRRVRCGPPLPNLGVPAAATVHRPPGRDSSPPHLWGPGSRARAPAASCPPPPYLRGPGGVAKGRSRGPRDGAARRRRRLVSPGQSSAAVSGPQTPSGATGTAPLAAAKAATGPPPPPSLRLLLLLLSITIFNSTT